MPPARGQIGLGPPGPPARQQVRVHVPAPRRVMGHLEADDAPADATLPVATPPEPRQGPLEAPDDVGEGVVTGARGEGDEHPAVAGMPSATRPDRWPQPGHRPLTPLAGAVGTQPDPAALGGDGLMQMAIGAAEGVELGATAGDGRCPAGIARRPEQRHEAALDRSCVSIK